MSGVVSPEWNTHGECGWCKGVTGEAPQCWCARCHHMFGLDKGNDGWSFFQIMSLNHMFLCPDCGNKRCPKATAHTQACTGSNKPGQEGSAY